jgi:S1-C subfamily serine protease
MSTEDVFKAARSAIVEIVTQDKSGSPLLTGTGFFISNDGKLVTNRHVVEGYSFSLAASFVWNSGTPENGEWHGMIRPALIHGTRP